jgi:hypothetical protein
MFKPTNANLIAEAQQIEQFAKDSLRAYCLLGQVAKYEAEMEQVRKLRHAVTIKGLRARKEYLGWH